MQDQHHPVRQAQLVTENERVPAVHRGRCCVRHDTARRLDADELRSDQADRLVSADKHERSTFERCGRGCRFANFETLAGHLPDVPRQERRRGPERQELRGNIPCDGPQPVSDHPRGRALPRARQPVFRFAFEQLAPNGVRGYLAWRRCLDCDRTGGRTR